MPPKRTYFFDFLNQISYIKNPGFWTDETAKDWNSYMILRYLSMDSTLLPLVNNIQLSCEVLEPRQLYNYLLEIIPRKKRFFKYIKSTKNIKVEDLEYITKLYNCSRRSANEYGHIMGEGWIAEIKQSFGGLVKDSSK